MSNKVALVAGVSGVVGRRLAEALVAAGWQVIGCARRRPAAEDRLAGVDYVELDLKDADACRGAIRQLARVTHLFYAARHEFATGQHEAADVNTLMFSNILDAVEAAGHPLEHVHLVHGTKYYGSTLGRFPTPAREDDPRCLLVNFYYDQEDIAIARAAAGGWHWSASRPHAICDSSLTTPRSLPLLIATYAAICRHLGQPLWFPGTEGNYRAVYQCTDASLLARAIVWMASDPRCADQAFNVSNGDFFRWERLWPVFARYFGLAPGPVRTVKLAELMPHHAPVWRAIVEQHRLAPVPYERMALWSYGDFVLTPDWDMMSDTNKLRRCGFNEFLDTEEMFLRQFDEFRRANVMPRPAA